MSDERADLHLNHLPSFDGREVVVCTSTLASKRGSVVDDIFGSVQTVLHQWFAHESFK